MRRSQDDQARPHAPGHPALPPGEPNSPALRATPYPTKSETPPDPYAKADTMLRGFTKDGVVHILGGATLPDGVFVKIIRE
jgi:ribonuclease HI